MKCLQVAGVPQDEAMSDHEELDLMAAAVLLATRGKAGGIIEQKEIAEHLTKKFERDIKQPKVSSLLKAAVEKGILDPRPKLGLHAETDKEWCHRFARMRIHLDLDVAKLCKKYAGCGAEIVVRDDEDAAIEVARLIESAKRIGVLWGRNVSWIVDQICKHKNPNGRDAEVVPITGSPVYLETRDATVRTATSVASRLYEWINGRGIEFPKGLALTTLPAFVPPELKQVRDFVCKTESYKKILGNPNCLVEQLDAVITSCGILQPENFDLSGAFIRERFLQLLALERSSRRETLLKKFKANVLGDIAGWILPTAKADNRFIKKLNDGWLGITADHLTSLAQNARKKGGAGVIVVANRPEKAAVIDRSLRLNLINNLIITREVAWKLLDPS